MRQVIENLIGVAVFGLTFVVGLCAGLVYRRLEKREAALKVAQSRLEEEKRAWYARQRVELLKLSSSLEGGSEVLTDGGKVQYDYWIVRGKN